MHRTLTQTPLRLLERNKRGRILAVRPSNLVEKTPISASSVDQSVHSGEGMSAIPLEQSGSVEQTTQQDNGTYQESEVDEKTGGHGADGTDPDRSVDREGPRDNTSKPSGTSNPRQKRNQTTGWKPTNQRKSNKLTKGIWQTALHMNEEN